MKIDNKVLSLTVCEKGGEMSSLTYKGYDVLYKGDKEYWSGKNPTLFPIIGSPNSKEYVLDGVKYPIKNHGLIRYADLKCVCDDGEKITMRLHSDEETLKQYPFEFNYEISYRLDNNKVLIDYEIRNESIKIMPFTFGLHPGFNVRNFEEMSLVFPEDEDGTLVDMMNGKIEKIKLGEYKNFIEDVTRLETVVLAGLKSKYVILKMKEYSVKVDMSSFKYLGLWTKNEKCDYMCIEPWLSINDIAHAENPFDDKYELEHLNPGETFKIGYYFEIID